MPPLFIKSFLEELHAKLRQAAANHRGSVTQETIHLIEVALTPGDSSVAAAPARSKWANRKLLPEYETLVKSRAFVGGTDSAQVISEERDAR